MKLLAAFLVLFSLQSAFAQVTPPTETPEDQEQSRKLRCNVIKTPWYLKKSVDHTKKIASCWLPGCQLVHARKAEKNFCKAVNVCDSLNEYLNAPCTEDLRLTPEAREDMVGYLKTAAVEAYEFVKELIKNGRE